MIFEIFMIIIGFVLLILGANVLVKGATNIAKTFNIPEILIGLTIVALGTSAPELIITITSASKGFADLIIGNAIGSNLCNLLLILGLMAIIKPIKIDKEAKNIHIPISFLATLITFIMGLSGTISRMEGIILLVLFITYFLYPIIIEIKSVGTAISRPKGRSNILISILFILLGVILLKYGGDFVVNYSTKIAQRFNVSQRVIGLTILSIGTSFPELVTSIVAIAKKDTDLAVGNIVGSCILNLFLILGVGGLITPLSYTSKFNGNIVLLLFSTMLIWLFNFIGKKNTIGRVQGMILILIFLYYITMLFI